jgi:hypothetical protein
VVGDDLRGLGGLTGDEAEPRDGAVGPVEGVPDEPALPLLAHDPGVTKVREVARDGRGRDVEDGRELADAERAVAQREEDPQPDRARENGEARGESGERQIVHFDL